MSAPRLAMCIAFVVTAGVAACGGKTSDLGGPGSSSGGGSGGGSGGSSGSGSSSGVHGSSGSSGASSSGASSGGSSSGASSSGGSSGASSGGSSASSSGGSTSSSGGGGCPAQPGVGACYPGDECTYGSGCDAAYCTCDANGGWICSVADCPPPACPPSASPGTACFESGQSCNYGSFGGGCGLECWCGTNADGSLTWSCAAPPCPPPACPVDPPQPGTACSPAGVGSCYYDVDAGCGVMECDCAPAGEWYCTTGVCVDAGAPEDASAGPG